MLARTATRKALSARIAAPTRRLLTTEAKPKKRSTWKGTALRWGLAGAGIYYYNTNDIFAEQEQLAIDRLEQSIHNVQQSELPTIDAIVAEKRARAAARAAEEARREQTSAINAEESVAPIAIETAEPVVEAVPRQEGEEAKGASIEDLEAEADQQGAFNPETGEINWDCPCLGGMAHGPCGPDFREAFSCFVYSKEEPKGMECIDKFKGMQDCFRAHPEMYGSELEDDEEYVEAQLREEEDAKAAARGDVSRDEASFSAPSATSDLSHQANSAPKQDTAAAVTPTNPMAGDESGDLVTKAVADALEAQKE